MTKGNVSLDPQIPHEYPQDLDHSTTDSIDGEDGTPDLGTDEYQPSDIEHVCSHNTFVDHLENENSDRCSEDRLAMNDHPTKSMEKIDDHRRVQYSKGSSHITIHLL